MKTNITYTKFSTIALLLVCLIMFESCATKHVFTTSPVVPAAEGSVKVKKDNNSNYNIELKIMRLADAKRLSPSRELYIVWMETEMNGTRNIGQLNTSSGLLSNTLKSTLKTVSAFKPKAFFITAEDNATIQYPAGQVVLRTSSF